MFGFWLGFKFGFAAAWKANGIDRIIKITKDRATEESLIQIEPIVEQRIKETEDSRLANINQVIAKREEFRRKKEEAKTPELVKKFGHYLTVIDWMIQEHGEKL